MRPPPFMAWNLFLAAVPLALSMWLFRRSSRRTVLWWCGLVAFVAFLPNAPYVLSDGVHLVRALRTVPSWPRAIVMITGFGAFFFLGLEAYALCIANVRHYLGRVVVPLELALHGLCAVGVYLGRVNRFNSWDLLGEGHLVLHSVRTALVEPWPATLVVFTFVVTVVACETLLRVNLLAARVAGRRPGR